ncbi:MAG: NlpC/P60 family protein [Clostridiales bacterium]|nr:NlpC/P60 family protein [Clostridiales bacterium]
MLTESRLKSLENTFGSHVSDYEDFIRTNYIGKRTADCVGLIKGYGWYNEKSGTIKYGTNSMQDVTANGMYAAATEKGTIDTMPDIPGLAVWHDGHIGIYVGNGYVIHAANTYDGVIKTPITSSGWTHWLKIPYIKYIEEE